MINSHWLHIDHNFTNTDKDSTSALFRNIIETFLTLFKKSNMDAWKEMLLKGILLHMHLQIIYHFYPFKTIQIIYSCFCSFQTFKTLKHTKREDFYYNFNVLICMIYRYFMIDKNYILKMQSIFDYMKIRHIMIKTCKAT